MVGTISMVAILVSALAGLTLSNSPSGEGEFVMFGLSAQEECAEGEVSTDEGVLIAHLEGQECTLLATTAGDLDGFFSLGAAIQSRIPQPPEFFGFFRGAHISTTFLVPSAPPVGTEIFAAQLLNHLILVWAFEQDGIDIAPIGDPIAHFLPPAPPPYFAGTVAGRVRYGEPFEVRVGMTTDAHMIVVRQAGSIVIAATLKKVFSHPDRISHATIFLASGPLQDYPIWSYDAAGFQGVKSPAEVIIGIGAEPVSQDLAIRWIRRIGDQVRVSLW